MNTPSANNEIDNLVLFPSSKNFPLDPLEVEKYDDPMMDLLLEFSDIKEEDLAHIEKLETEESELNFDSLEAYMNRHQPTMTLSEDDRLVLMIDERIGQIHEARARIKFYLDELEMFLPRRR